MLRSLAIAILSALASLPIAVVAAPVGDAPPGGSGEPTPRRIENDVSGDLASGQQGVLPTVDVEGKVLDSAGQPLAGVLVKAFADGVLSGSAKSANDGSFRLSASLVETSGNGSAVLWFQSPNTDHLDGQVVLWTGEAARAQGLFPPCTPLVPVEAGRMTGKIQITMQTADERQRDVVASDCLDRAGALRSPR